jgi:hypothetical protein
MMTEGEKARIMRAAIASTADALPGYAPVLAQLADEAPALVLAALYDAMAQQLINQGVR